MTKHYCPFCQRDIDAEKDEFGEEINIEGGRVFVHDEVPHDPDYKFEDLQ